MTVSEDAAIYRCIHLQAKIHIFGYTRYVRQKFIKHKQIAKLIFSTIIVCLELQMAEERRETKNSLTI